MSLLTELHVIVEERADPARWARKALLTLEYWASIAGVRTWHVERVVYAAALLLAVVAQHAPTLGAGGIVQALRDTAALGLSLAALLYGAELDSISAREREQAEADGREPVRVECSPRAAQLRAWMPWLGLAALAFAFGWVGAVALAWRTAYPQWRRLYRAHRPVRRVRWMPQRPGQCGQTCVAMLTGQPVGNVCAAMGRDGECGAYGLQVALQAAGRDLDPWPNQDVPPVDRQALVLLRRQEGQGHWVVWDRGVVACPTDGLLPASVAFQEWEADGWFPERHHTVLDRVVFPLPPRDVEAYRRAARPAV